MLEIIDWLNLFKSFTELIESIKLKPKYFVKTIDYCINKVNYIVLIKPDSAMTTEYRLSDIYNAVCE